MAEFQGNFIKYQVLKEVFKYLCFEGLQNCRLVCRRWNCAIVTSPMLASRFTYNLDGINRDSWFDSVTTLNSAPEKWWTNFRFTNINMDDICLGNALFFEFFVLTFRHKLSSVEFMECTLSVGRFVELLAYCKNIKKIKIDACPYLFQTSAENWEEYLPYFYKNLRNVQSLEISERKGNINNVLHNFYGHLTNLKRLWLLTSVESRILGRDIVYLTTRNKNLENLALGLGNEFSIEELQQIFCSDLKLRELSLGTMELPARFPFPTPALNSLTSLTLSRIIYYDTSKENPNRVSGDLFRNCTKVSKLGLFFVEETMVKTFFAREWKSIKVLELTVNVKLYSGIFRQCPNITYLLLTKACVTLSRVSRYLKKLERLHLENVYIMAESGNSFPHFSLFPSLSEITLVKAKHFEDLGELLSKENQMNNLRGLFIVESKMDRKGFEALLKSSANKFPLLEQLSINTGNSWTISPKDLQMLQVEYGCSTQLKVRFDTVVLDLEEEYDFYS